MQSKPVEPAYAECLTEAQQHYENFPTATRLVAKQHRNATAAIYSFARRADDIADENPSLTDQERLDGLENMNQQLLAHLNGIVQNDHTFVALTDTIKKYELPLLPFEKLIKAFSMDVVKKRFANFKELQYYCEHSANPVGELILRLHGFYSTKSALLSDQICSALQLINFLQDIAEDFEERGRIYLPQDEMLHFHVSESQLQNRDNSPELQELILRQLHRARHMLINGAPLTSLLRGRLRLVIMTTILSGLRVCEKLEQRRNVFARPTLTRSDWLLILARLAYFRYYVAHVRSKIKSQGN